MSRSKGVRPTTLTVTDLGRIGYAEALELQRQTLEHVLKARDADDPCCGELFLLEHDPPVITVSRRAKDGTNLLATDAQLNAHGVELHETDRGGDITYHGPGQLVLYPILDLSRLGLNLHAYMQLLEQVVIDLCSGLGLHTARDPSATGVWLTDAAGAGEEIEGSGERKVCAIGIRVRRWVSMHGLALNVRTNLDHFGLIVPCGLAGRSVTTLETELGADATPSMDELKSDIAERFAESIGLQIIRG
jgi:lipoyl(octanoyl) transferase